MRCKHKKQTILIVLLVSFLLLSFVQTYYYGMSSFPTVNANPDWLTGWSYRKSHVINYATGAGTLYQKQITVHYGSGTDGDDDVYLNSHCRTDFGDVRFTDDDGTTLLDYWMESKVDSDNAVFWVEVADDLSSSNATIYVYYGKIDAITYSRGQNTFAFLDEFEKWTKKGIVISESTTLANEPNVIYDTNPQILTSETYVFKMWYRVGASSGSVSIYYAESTDGINWTKYSGNPVLSGADLFCPFVMKYDGTFYMYVHNGCTSIDRYYSSNGISWTKDKADSLTDATNLGNCFVWVEAANDWRMMYEYNSALWKIGYATSTDGKTWTKSGSNPVLTDTGSCGGPEVHKVGSTYYMWYQNAPSGGLPTDICRASSTDLITWTKFGGSTHPVFLRTETYEGAGNSQGQVADPCIIEAKGETWMWYDSNVDQTATNGKIALAKTSYTIAELITTAEDGLDTVNLWQGATTYANLKTHGILTILADTSWRCINGLVQKLPPYAMHWKGQIVNGYTTTKGGEMGLRDPSTTDLVQLVAFDIRNAGGNKFSCAKAGSYTSVNTNIDYNMNVYEITWTTTAVHYYKNNVEMTGSPYTNTAYIPTVDLATWFGSIGGAGYEFKADYVFLRKFVDPEPSHGGWGSEETEAPPPSVTLTITSPTNTTYTTSTITITMSASGGTIDRIWFNIKSGGSWLYPNTTYTAPTTKTLTNGIYTFYGWANNTDGNSDGKTVVFTVNIPSAGFNLYFETNGKLAFQHLSVPWETKGATITLTVTSGTLKGTSASLAMYPTSGTLTFTALENGAITLTSTSNGTTFHINGAVANSASIVNGQTYTLEWSFIEPEFLLPVMFILGMFGLGSMFGGPIYGIYKVKHGEYYEGFKTGLILTVLGVALTIAWLWGA